MRKYLVFKTDDFAALMNYFAASNPELNLTPGYVNGTTAFPTFEMVVSKQADHSMGVKAEFDDGSTQIKDLVTKYIRYLGGKQGGVYYNDLLDGVECEVTISENGKNVREISVDKLCNFFPAEKRFRIAK